MARKLGGIFKSKFAIGQEVFFIFNNQLICAQIYGVQMSAYESSDPLFTYEINLTNGNDNSPYDQTAYMPECDVFEKFEDIPIKNHNEVIFK